MVEKSSTATPTKAMAAREYVIAFFILLIFKCLRIDVYNLTNNNLKVIFSKYNRMELSSYIKHNSLKEEGINKLVDILADYKETLNSFNISDIHVYATAFLWNMKNSLQPSLTKQRLISRKPLIMF